MAVEVFLPKMSDHMESGRILRWLFKEGDAVERGQALLEIETDKATGELEAPASGILTGVRAAEGDSVPVGETLALIARPGEVVQRPAASPAGNTTVTAPAVEEEIKATPLARRVAKEMGVDLARVKGSGPKGIIRDEDVRSYAASLSTPTPAAAAVPPPALAGSHQGLPLSKIQAVTGQRMAESFNRAPHFYVQVSADMTRALDLLDQLKGKIEAETGESLTLTVLLVKATAAAIQKMPRVNTVFERDQPVVTTDINLGIAMSSEEDLFVPVIKQANTKSLADITRELKQLQAKARSKHLTLEDLSGGTFTISNLGMFGVDVFHAIINPPQSSILAVGRVVKTPVGMPDDTIALRPMMNLALSADHRVLDGVQAARFLGELKGLLETPAVLL
jgi:pyruvate dehydrogenase E2 component (dihydrolipoamide acetyltransferase)